MAPDNLPVNCLALYFSSACLVLHRHEPCATLQVLKEVGPDEVVDIDNALCRESLDVIGVHLLLALLPL